MTPARGRVIALHSDGPAHNMSLDQAMLEQVDAGGVPTLRWYQWDRPTLSLGYFQALADRQKHPQSLAVACVRRASGGGAILHHHELTYSIAWPSKSALGGSPELYCQVHQAFAAVLRSHGLSATPFVNTARPAPAGQPFLCFQRRSEHDLIANGYKVLGSAQRRGKRAVLQHGSLLLRSSPWAPQLPGVFDLGGSPLPVEQLAVEVTAAIARKLALQWQSGTWSQQERQRSEQIVQKRFAAKNWLRRR